MKKAIAALLSAGLCLASACGAGRENTAPMPDRNTAQVPEYQEPDYRFDAVTTAERIEAEDGTILARYSYQILSMSVSNLEKLSPEVQEAVERSVENFNKCMGDLLDRSLESGRELGNSAQELYEDEASFKAFPFYDETSIDSVVTGQIVSVRVDNASYAGGAHPGSYTSSYLFDLSVGQFIDASQIAEDPLAFQTGVAELLVEKAEALGEEYTAGYWENYRDIIRTWNEGTVLFSQEGMTVVYSPYELGPYAMGAVELFASYDELAELLGPGGLAHLGVGAEENP